MIRSSRVENSSCLRRNICLSQAKAFGVFALLLLLVNGTAAANPNIVFITAADLNFDALGCYGSPIAGITPHLDRLASEGMSFDRAYSTVAVCQPVRQAMLAAAKTDPRIKARTDFYLHRVPEEFYDMTGDRYERANLIADPARQAEIEAARAEILAELRRIGDPLAEAFARRDEAAFLAAEKAKLAAVYKNARSPRKGTEVKAAAPVASDAETTATREQRDARMPHAKLPPRPGRDELTIPEQQIKNPDKP